VATTIVLKQSAETATAARACSASTVTSRRFSVIAENGNSEDRAKKGDSKNHCAIHRKSLQ